MLSINSNNMVSGQEIHRVIESKNKRFDIWVKRVIEYADLKPNKDFRTKVFESSGGRKPTDYEFTLDAAKEICLLERNEKGKEIRRWLIGISNQVDTSDLLTHDQVLYLVKLKEVFKYINNCKEATKLHTEKFVSVSDAKNPYAEFHLFRNDILKLGKEEIDERLRLYCAEHFINPKAKTTTEKLAIIDKFEVLRNGVWDFLMASGSQQSLKLANLAMNMAKLDHTPIYRNNETNLFQQKQSELNVKQLAQIQELTRE